MLSTLVHSGDGVYGYGYVHCRKYLNTWMYIICRRGLYTVFVSDTMSATATTLWRNKESFYCIKIRIY